MKKVSCLLIITYLFLFISCNTNEEIPGHGGGGGGSGEELFLNMGDTEKYVLESGDEYPGAEIDLTVYLADGAYLEDISNYRSVVVNATLYSDENFTTIASKENSSDNLAQFKLMRNSGDWTDPIGGDNGTKYNMSVNGDTTWFVPSGASGVPAKLLIQANYADFPEKVKSFQVNSVTFKPILSGSDYEVVFDWGEVTTDLLTEGQSGNWPGKSLPLDGANDPPVLLDLSNYSRIIVDAVILDRNENAFSDTGKEPYVYTNDGTQDQANAFFTLTTAEGDWQDTERVKQYDMVLDGETDVTPDTNKVSGDNAWKDIPTHIVFQARYDSGKPDDETVGYVTLRKITFILKAE